MPPLQLGNEVEPSLKELPWENWEQNLQPWLSAEGWNPS